MILRIIIVGLQIMVLHEEILWSFAVIGLAWCAISLSKGIGRVFLYVLQGLALGAFCKVFEKSPR